jgi:hypothetical protein
MVEPAEQQVAEQPRLFAVPFTAASSPDRQDRRLSDGLFQTRSVAHDKACNIFTDSVDVVPEPTHRLRLRGDLQRDGQRWLSGIA